MADWRNDIKKALAGLLGEIRFGQPLAPYTTFRIGGPADIFIIAEDQNDIPLVLKTAQEFNLPVFVLGGGSNLLVADEGIRGIVLTLGKKFQFIKIQDAELEVGAAVRLPTLIETCVEHSLAGIEFLAGIPARLGGAIKSNAGAFGSSLGDVVRSVFGFLATGRPGIFSRAELEFSYHVSRLPPGFIITSAILELRPEEKTAIEKKVAEVRNRRKKTQPDQPSAGCIFKNPPGEHTGRLIDKIGLKGKTVGDAMVSERHANFIVNRGTARASDVLQLINEIKQQVEHETGFKLEEEIIIVRGGSIDEN